ncbi:MAG: ParB N-terminal domain-containing protein, partial [Dehalococcoidia bacterium]|nr:ParB N-terminal domain-containing protein [Dehalococcoidia bacterium]
MPSKRSSSSAVAEAPLSAADVPWIHPELAASAIAAGGAGGLGLIAVSDLANDPSNVRRHGEKNHEATRASLRKFGQRTPIVVQKQGMVVRAGNDRLAIFREEGWTHIVALVVNENDVEATAYAIADNRTGELAEWDDDALARQLDALQKQGIDLDGLGFDLDDLDELDLGELVPDADLDDNGPEEPPVKPVSRSGDLWILGDHRLLCGDSTNPDDVARVLAGDRPPLLSTDPPYCVNYTGADRPAGVDGKPSGKDWSHVYREVDIKDLGEFLDGVLAACLPFVAEDAPIYMWHAHVQQPTIAAAFERHDLLLHQVVVWVKPCAVFGHSYFRWRHEPCAFGWRKGHKPTHGTAQLDTVWEADWEGKARVVGNEHPCLHPDALVLTDAGYRPIHDIQVGARVLAADGAFHTVTDVSAHAYHSPELIQIVAKGGNAPTLASDNHPFLIWRPERVGRRVKSGEVAWVRADEIQVGDYTMTPVLAETDEDPFADRDQDYWYLFGLYLAQGSLQKAGHGENRYPTFALHKKRQDIVNRITTHFASVSEYDSNDYGVLSSGLTVMAFDPEAGAEFERLGSKLAHAKRLAPEVFLLPREKRLAVLRGWLNGDGCQVHGRDYWQGKTVSPDLAAHLALLAESVGYKANVFRYEPAEEPVFIEGRRIRNRQAVYHLYFYDRDTMERGNRIPHVEHEGRTYTLRYVKGIDRVPYEGDVWNLSVEGNPTFQTAVGMSHNTQKPLRLFEIPMEL